MLVLSRKVRQKIVIDDNIELVVVSVIGNRVLLGFNAPDEVSIYREEVFNRMQAENRSYRHDEHAIPT